jgi:hypothetical protein
VRFSPRRAAAATAAVCALGLGWSAVAAVPGSGFAGSLAASMPADEATPSDTCTQASRSEAQENALAGTSDWRITPGIEEDTTVGYLDRTSAQCGDRVTVHVSAPGLVTVSAYRVGWYAGTGGRLVWSGPERPGSPHGLSLDSATHMVEASWPVTTSFVVTPDWTPGIYLVEVRPAGSHGPRKNGSVMPLVVEGDGSHPVLAVASTLTWSAYNWYGGFSTYFAKTRKQDVAVASSWDRPLSGSGLRHLMVYDLPLARFMSQLNMDVDWTTDEELDARPSQASAHRELVFGGHSEYWTARMYDAVEAARNSGTNIAFLGADAVYWQPRLAASPLGPRRRMYIYRDANRDPEANGSPASATVRWRDNPLDRDEAELVGTTYARWNVRGGMQVEDAPSWVLEGTGLTTGSPLVAAGANEVDRFSTARGASPLNLQVVLRGAYSTSSADVTDFAAVFYTVPGGGAVFSAGTTAWPCDLEADCPWGPVPQATAQAVRKITENVLLGFTTSAFAATHPSHSTRSTPTAVFWQHLAPALRGTAGDRTYGGLDDD